MKYQALFSVNNMKNITYFCVNITDDLICKVLKLKIYMKWDM